MDLAKEFATLREEIIQITGSLRAIGEMTQIREEVEQIKGELDEIKRQDATNSSSMNAQKNDQEAKELQEKVRLEEHKQAEEAKEKERKAKEASERTEKERKEKEAQDQRAKVENERKQAEKQRKEKEEKEERERREKEAKEKQIKEENERKAKETTPSYSGGISSAQLRQAERKSQDGEKPVGEKVATSSSQKPSFQQFGLDSELHAKALEKYSPALEEEAKTWIINVTGEAGPTGSFGEWLHSGVILCNLINKLQPNTIKKVNKMKAPFMQMENINNFLTAAKSLGVPQVDLFMTVDLYEEKNMGQVVTSIHSLGRVSRRISGFSGPYLGAKLSDKHETNFSEEQLKRGQYELNFSQASQSDSQKVRNEMQKSEMDKIVRTKSTGTASSHPSLFDKDKSEAQKEANAARRQKHGIIH